ncbi:hypothetical protein EDD85DRAFT_958466 [Armillaria nabsnona]|nr:hypothetical protein EDD85DRAFT_958466 [Armillaria nabsnona]
MPILKALPGEHTPHPLLTTGVGPSKSSFGFSFGPATLLLLSLPSNDTGADLSSQTTVLWPSNLLAVNAKDHSNFLQGAGSSAPLPGTVSSSAEFHMSLFSLDTDGKGAGDIQTPEQGQGALVGDAFKVALIQLMAGNNNVPIPLTHTVSNRKANPPPYVHQEPKILFVFDNITRDWDPYPTILLPRPQCSAPTEQEVCCSFHPCTSSVGHDAAYLAAVQGSKPKKDKKSKNQGTTTAMPCKHAHHEDKESETTEGPSSKKTKVKDVMIVSGDEHQSFLFLSQLSIAQFPYLAVAATKVIHKQGPGPAKPLPVTLGISGKGFSEKVPSLAKVVKNGIKIIGIDMLCKCSRV